MDATAFVAAVSARVLLGSTPHLCRYNHHEHTTHPASRRHRKARAAPMAAAAPAGSSNDRDLLIIGAGVLGREIAAEWQTLFPGASIIGETRTDKSHADLRALDITPRISDAHAGTATPPYVVFCAPPSGSVDYAGAVHAAVQRALMNDGDMTTRFIFTSSGGIHGRDTPLVTETTPVAYPQQQQTNAGGETAGDKAERTKTSVEGGRSATLARAEHNVLTGHENSLVIRLSGLYTLHRGAHSYWLRAGEVKSSPHGLLNLIHYRDAARAVVRALLVDRDSVAAWPQRNLLACVQEPISRGKCCEAALRHPEFSTRFSMPTFSPPSDKPEVTRVYNNEWTRSVLDWAPKWESFERFMDDELAMLSSAP